MEKSLEDVYFRVVSDLHLNYYRSEDWPYIIEEILAYQTSIPSTKVILILAGDLGNPSEDRYFQFLELLSRLFKQVFFIAGNHEYYSNNFQEIKKKLNDYSYPENVVFLDQTVYYGDNFRILGCTFWSNNDTSVPFKTKNDQKITYDLNGQIKNLDEQVYNQLHWSDRNWLNSELDKKYSGKTVVVTHHCPSLRLLDPKYSNSERNCYYGSNSDRLVVKSDVWICGHSHFTRHQIIENTRIYLNPFGYPSDDLVLDDGLIVI